MLIFSFRARAGRLLLLDVFLPNIVLASHVLGMSVMCVFKKPALRGRPSTTLIGCFACSATDYRLGMQQLIAAVVTPIAAVVTLLKRGKSGIPDAGWQA